MNDLISPRDVLNLSAMIEALLFVSPEAVTPAQLAAALDYPLDEIESGLNELEELYLLPNNGRGLRLQRSRGGLQLTTAPEAAEAVEKFLGLEGSGRLSRASLEVLAITMYKQPVTRPQIDAIRGVNSEGVLKNLLQKGLIQEVGRAEAPGRPIVYATTVEFLQYFGLNSLADLPPLNSESNIQSSTDNA